MPREFSRTHRIAEQVRRELAELIRAGMKDPRIGMVTLTDAEVSPDHAHARVFFTILGDADQLEETTVALRHATGFLRSQLARRMRLRTVPQLEFVFDASVERGVRLSRLIDEAVASDTGQVDKK